MSSRRVIASLVIVSTIACHDQATDPTGLADGSHRPAANITNDGIPIVISDIQVIDLGTLPGGTSSTARDINDAGDIVGWSDTGSGDTHAFVLTGTGMTDLGTLPGGDDSRAFGINDLGQVVGDAAPPNGGVPHAFFWDGGSIEDLGCDVPEEHGLGCSANAINNFGLIAGSVDFAGVVWDLTGVPNVPPFPFVIVSDPGPLEFASSQDITDAGQVAGILVARERGFRWQASVLELLRWGPGGIGEDWVNGINAAGHVVGRQIPHSGQPPVRHAVLWPDTMTVIDLGALGTGNSEAHDINVDDLVVGYSGLDGGDSIAFVWAADLGMQPLGTLGGANSIAYGINSSGQIVGESQTASGETHATLWTISIAVEAEIDVRPGSDDDPVNPRSQGVIPVALLSTEFLDATTVDPASLVLGPGEAHVTHAHTQDVNGDGTLDLMLHFSLPETGIVCGDTDVALTGETFDGQPIQGTGSITTVGCTK